MLKDILVSPLEGKEVQAMVWKIKYTGNRHRERDWVHPLPSDTSPLTRLHLLPQATPPDASQTVPQTGGAMGTILTLTIIAILGNIKKKTQFNLLPTTDIQVYHSTSRKIPCA